MPSLYELTNDFVQLSEIEDMENDAVKDTLESIQLEIEDKTENIAKLIKNITSDSKAIKEEEDRLKARRQSLDNKATYLKQYLHEQLEFAGLTKIKRPTVTVSIQANPPSLKVLDPTLIPSHYMIPVEPTIDKKAMLSVLKEGKDIPGVEIFQGRSVRIR